MNLIKKSIKTILRNFLGIEIFWTRNVPLSIENITNAQMVASLRKFEIDMVFDIGANKGQFASDIRDSGYTGRILSFEPLSSAYTELINASARDDMWEVYPRCALGDFQGEIELNVAGNSESSSILPMLESHRNVAPESAYQGKEVVSINRLDLVARQYLKDSRAAFMKIDTQGFEWEVLDGAGDLLPLIKGVLVELSLVPLYEGQHLWREIIDRLEAEGFSLWAFKPVFSDQATGRTLQVDGIFYRTSQPY